MPDTEQKPSQKHLPRVRLTVRLTLAAYDAIVQIQRRHRAREGSALPIWKVIDAAIKAYEQGLPAGE